MSYEIDLQYLHQTCKELISSVEGRKKFGLSKFGKQLQSELEQAFPQFLSARERFYACAHDIKERPTCQSCQAPVGWFGYENGFSLFCSRGCSNRSNETKSKTKMTNTSKFGVDSFSKTEEFKRDNSVRMKNNSSEIQQKRARTLAEKFGSIETAYEHIWEKGRDTLHKQHGVDNYSKIPNNKAVQTRNDRYLENLPAKIRELETEFNVTALWDIADYPLIKNGQYQWKHQCGHEFISHFSYAGIRPECPACKPKSKYEKFIADFLSAEQISFMKNDRTIIKPLELDFVIGNVAIEVNGWYWHQDGDTNRSLLRKTEMAEEKGLRLIHIWDWEIDAKPEAVKKLIRDAIRTKTIGARTCVIQHVEKSDAKIFCENNHFSGWAGASICLGLYRNDQLLALATFAKPRFSKHADWELVRFCTASGITITGGISKILKFFNTHYPGRLISYSDRRLFTGESYAKTGFKLKSINAPSYVWRKGNTNLSRFSTQKHKLQALLGDRFNSSLSEYENMKAAGWARLSDSGTMTWLLDNGSNSKSDFNLQP